MSRYTAAFTMFVFLKGRPVLEYYFGLQDAFWAANDSGSPAGAEIVSLHRASSSRGTAPPPRPAASSSSSRLRRRTDP
jgi:hypothetical protein